QRQGPHGGLHQIRRDQRGSRGGAIITAQPNREAALALAGAERLVARHQGEGEGEGERCPSRCAADHTVATSCWMKKTRSPRAAAPGGRAARGSGERTLAHPNKPPGPPQGHIPVSSSSRSAL